MKPTPSLGMIRSSLLPNLPKSLTVSVCSFAALATTVALYLQCDDVSGLRFKNPCGRLLECGNLEKPSTSPDSKQLSSTAPRCAEELLKTTNRLSLDRNSRLSFLLVA